MAYRETVLRFLSLQYGTTDGWAGLGIKTSSGEFSETWFPWPSGAEQMATAAVQEDSCGSDVWFCASVMREPKRAIGSSVARPRLHADIDRELTDEDAHKIEQLGAWVVYSGTPGHVHVYVELNEVVDVATYHSLENSLCAWLGADAKKRDNDLLRIPGLSNHKQQHPREVVWDGSTGLRRWDAMELGAQLPTVAYAAPENSSAAIAPEPVEVIPPHIGALLTTQAGSDRSTQAAKIINACAAAQFTEGETLYTLVQDPVQRERFQQKPATVFAEIRKMRGTYIDIPAQEIQGFKELLGIPQDQPLPIGDTPPVTVTVAKPDPVVPVQSEDDFENSMLTLDQLRLIPPPTPFVEGLLYKGTIARLSGHPGAYKSFLALSIACGVASQCDLWGGLGVYHHGPVVYVAAEGASGLALRVDAWCDENGVDPKTLDIRIRPAPVQFTEEHMQRLIDYVNKRGVMLVIFDTQSRMTVGMDENTAKDMGLAVHHLEQLMDQTDTTALLLHHTTKEGSTARGSSVWEGAVWTELLCKKEGQGLTVKCEKHKDAPDGCEHGFLMNRKEVGLEETLVMVPRAGFEAQQKDVRERLLHTMDETASPWISISELVNDYGFKKTSADRAMKQLIDDGFVESSGAKRGATYALKSRV